MEFTEEQIAQAYACKTPEDLLALAKANNVDLSEERARVFLELFAEEERTEGELADEELENVAGGAGCPKRRAYNQVDYNTKEAVNFIFEIGEEVQAFVDTGLGGRTATVRIIDRKIKSNDIAHKYHDVYKVKKLNGCGIFELWQRRDRFQLPY